MSDSAALASRCPLRHRPLTVSIGAVATDSPIDRLPLPLI